MRSKSLKLCAALLLSGASALALAQQPAKPKPDQGMMGGGMMGGGDMMGMMNMMRECEKMMREPRAGMLPQLPQGNEKLQLQMHAEMMQRMGEIMAKYAERVREEPARGR